MIEKVLKSWVKNGWNSTFWSKKYFVKKFGLKNWWKFEIMIKKSLVKNSKFWLKTNLEKLKFLETKKKKTLQTKIKIWDKKKSNLRILNLIVIQNEWPGMIQAYWSIYRMSVFFWILIGLTWIGGVISMLTENFNLSVSNVRSIRITIPSKMSTFLKKFKPIATSVTRRRPESVYLSTVTKTKNSEELNLHNIDIKGIAEEIN